MPIKNCFSWKHQFPSYNYMLQKSRTAHGMEQKIIILMILGLCKAFFCTLVRNSAFFFFSSNWSFFSLAFSSAIQKNHDFNKYGNYLHVCKSLRQGRMLPSSCMVFSQAFAVNLVTYPRKTQTM